jgi:hypothetical protein
MWASKHAHPTARTSKPCWALGTGASVARMYRPRTIRFLRRENVGDWRLKVYGIGTHAPDARPEFVAASVDAARQALPEGGGAGFVIAHDAATAGLSLVYWWANENEIHARFFASPLDDPSAIAPYDGTGLGCVWEMEVLNFERCAWLEDVLKNNDIDAYLSREAPDTEI